MSHDDRFSSPVIEKTAPIADKPKAKLAIKKSHIKIKNPFSGKVECSSLKFNLKIDTAKKKEGQTQEEAEKKAQTPGTIPSTIKSIKTQAKAPGN